MTYEDFRRKLKARREKVIREHKEKSKSELPNLPKLDDEQLRMIVQIIRHHEFAKTGSVKFTVTERDGLGKIKSFIVEQV